MISSSKRPEQRQALLNDLFADFFIQQWRILLKWGALTGQSAQVDTGYIAQHVASIVLGEPGQGFRGKGLDLVDGTEVKSAAIVSGVDRPRWNHNMGTPADDLKRAAKGQSPTWETYLRAPNVFYLLFDRVVERVPIEKKVFRVRAWCIDAQTDHAWRDLILRFVELRGTSQYNLQLHPPVGYDDSLVVNERGNLDMEPVKVLEARLHGLGTAREPFEIQWVQQPRQNLRPVIGTCGAVPFGGRGARPSRLNAAADMLPDLAVLRELLPGVGVDRLLQAFSSELAAADLERSSKQAQLL